MLEEAVKLDPQCSGAKQLWASLHYERGQAKRAVEYYRRAIEARPEMAEAHNNLGNALRMIGDFDGALQAY